MHRHSRRHEKTCPTCGKQFVAKRPDKIFCKKDCWPSRVAQRNVKVERACATCGKVFETGSKLRLYCKIECRPSFIIATKRLDIPSATTGAISELVVAADLMAQGWAVFRALSPACFCDLIAVKDGISRYVEVRTGIPGARGGFSFSQGFAPGTTEYAVYIPQTKEVVYIPVGEKTAG